MLHPKPPVLAPRFRAGNGPEPEGAWGAYEEYWYDALGRRVLRRTRQESPICTVNGTFNRCYNAIDRYVWDGDQILWELRQNGSGDTKNPGGAGLTGQTGEIGYVHAGGIDQPIGMLKNGITVALHRNWRGLYAFATDADGEQTTCAPEWFSGCYNIPWPAWYWDVSHNGIDSQVISPWYGSLVMGHQDASGLNYRRNRYYDPESGQFTQEDPIGIAGGLNLYGYANGDPVNYSDPFGLCVPFPQCLLVAAGAGARVGTVIGAGIGSVVPGAGTLSGAGLGRVLGTGVAIGAVSASAAWTAMSSGHHRKAVDRVNTSLGIAAEHFARIGGMPPDDEDPNFLKDMLNHAQKHVNNANKYIRRVKGKTREELQRQIHDMQKWLDDLYEGGF